MPESYPLTSTRVYTHPPMHTRHIRPVIVYKNKKDGEPTEKGGGVKLI